MKNTQFKEYKLVIIIGLILFVSACSQNETNLTPTTHNTEAPILESKGTLSVTKVASTPTFSTVPTDAELDQTCRITITYFFSVDKSFDIKAIRNLFVPTRQYFADTIVQRQTPLFLLQLIPASEMWQKDHPSEPIPQFMLPVKSNQYIYYAEFSGAYVSNSTEVAPYPNSMLLIMESQEQYDCKIENYGWG
jgi:hypothetical protein